MKKMNFCVLIITTLSDLLRTTVYIVGTLVMRFYKIKQKVVTHQRVVLQSNQLAQHDDNANTTTPSSRAMAR